MLLYTQEYLFMYFLLDIYDWNFSKVLLNKHHNLDGPERFDGRFQTQKIQGNAIPAKSNGM